MVRGLLADPSHRVLGWPGDNFAYLWRLWWFKRTLLGTRYHRKRLLGGAETFMPPAFERRYHLMERFPDPAVRRMLADCGVKYLLLDTQVWRGGPVKVPWLREVGRAGKMVIYELRPP